jgi:hypothetical protein
MDANLYVGVGHNMPLLPELTAIWMPVAIKILLLRSTISVFQMSKLPNASGGCRTRLEPPWRRLRRKLDLERLKPMILARDDLRACLRFALPWAEVLYAFGIQRETGLLARQIAENGLEIC